MRHVSKNSPSLWSLLKPDLQFWKCCVRVIKLYGFVKTEQPLPPSETLSICCILSIDLNNIYGLGPCLKAE